MKYSILSAALALGIAPAMLVAQQPANQPGVSQPYETNKAVADDRTVDRNEIDRADEVTPTGLIRASQMMNAAVYNNAEEQVGTISDVVLDQRTGQARYVALSTGGFLGLGDALHAIPFKSVKTQVHDGDEVFVLNVDAERLENAKGFDQDNWPNMGDRNWQQTNDRQYGDYDRQYDDSDRVAPQQ
ncbi:PRC-barrel domain-containing protein [Botrimarina mediterranea]|uniref:PRC-barrel domain-containing protein n=1 Tax=Botrimarina mediterranea TaxID=2528022 RepID=UPI00118AD298|nr:PRC-barrel domain protein [Planctomycetes bacterium K2D]